VDTSFGIKTSTLTTNSKLLAGPLFQMPILTQEWVRDAIAPMPSVGLAAATGMVLGALLARGRHETVTHEVCWQAVISVQAAGRADAEIQLVRYVCIVHRLAPAPLICSNVGKFASGIPG